MPPAIVVGQRWQRNHFGIAVNRHRTFKAGESVVITRCPPKSSLIYFRRESTGKITGGYVPDAFRNYFCPGYVLYEDGKYHLIVNGHEVTADRLAEVEALQLAAKRRWV